MNLASRATLWAYKGGSSVARALPTPVASLAASGLGGILGRTMRGRRTMLARHLRRVHGQHLRGAALDAELRRAFDSYARYWLESFRLPDATPAQLDAGMSCEGLAHLQDAMEAGKGAIVAMPHLGGWDFGGAWLASIGLPITVVVEPVEPPELFEWFADLRRTLGLTVVPLGPEAGSVTIKALRAGELVGLVCDRDLAGTGIPVEFFGERTTLPAGPATLALRTGAALLPATVYFEGRRGHRGVVRPPLDTSRKGSLREDVARITAELAESFEGLIRGAPEQWHLLQPNWPSDFELAGIERPAIPPVP